MNDIIDSHFTISIAATQQKDLGKTVAKYIKAVSKYFNANCCR